MQYISIKIYVQILWCNIKPIFLEMCKKRAARLDYTTVAMPEAGLFILCEGGLNNVRQVQSTKNW